METIEDYKALVKKVKDLGRKLLAEEYKKEEWAEWVETVDSIDTCLMYAFDEED